jgi:hypothetical protein
MSSASVFISHVNWQSYRDDCNVLRLLIALPFRCCWSSGLWYWQSNGLTNLTNSPQQSLSREANSSSVSLCNLRLHCRIHKSLPKVHILSQMNPVYTLPFCSIKVHYTRGLISLWLHNENKKLRVWKKCIYSIYSPLSSTHLWLRCSNFFNPSQKNYFGCAANRKIRNRKSRRLISTPT